MIKETEEPIFDLEDRGYRCRAWYLKDSSNAIIEIDKDGESFRSFQVLAYKVYNIAAHFGDMVDTAISDGQINRALSPLPF